MCACAKGLLAAALVSFGLPVDQRARRLGCPGSYLVCFSNADAPVLLDDDVAAMKASVDVGRNLILSYKMMLDFYGMVLLDVETGAVGRSPRYRERYYATLETRSHNHLRVCRIMSCFSVLGFRHYKQPLYDFLAGEVAAGALRLSQHTLGMFRTYIEEGSAAYLRYSEVKLPGDHSPHVLFRSVVGPHVCDGHPAPGVCAAGSAAAETSHGCGGGSAGGVTSADSDRRPDAKLEDSQRTESMSTDGDSPTGDDMDDGGTMQSPLEASHSAATIVLPTTVLTVAHAGEASDDTSVGLAQPHHDGHDTAGQVTESKQVDATGSDAADPEQQRAAKPSDVEHAPLTTVADELNTAGPGDPIVARSQTTESSGVAIEEGPSSEPPVSARSPLGDSTHQQESKEVVVGVTAVAAPVPADALICSGEATMASPSESHDDTVCRPGATTVTAPFPVRTDQHDAMDDGGSDDGRSARTVSDAAPSLPASLQL